jgi:hypothetical protein
LRKLSISWIAWNCLRVFRHLNCLSRLGRHHRFWPGQLGCQLMSHPDQAPLAVDPQFFEVLCVDAGPSPAGRKVRTRRSGAQGQEKYETKRFHDTLLSLGDFFAGAEGREAEMLRLNEFVDGFINLQLTK